MPTFLDVDPRSLYLPGSRVSGADPAKLARQISLHGRSVRGMPVIFVYRDGGGRLQIYDGVTRATRVAKLMPGQQVRVEVIAEQPKADYSRFPTVGDRLP